MSGKTELQRDWVKFGDISGAGIKDLLSVASL